MTKKYSDDGNDTSLSSKQRTSILALMQRHESDQRLSQISTAWSVLKEAHTGLADRATAAQQLLMERYGGAIQRYLSAALRDAAAADDLTQEFALGLVRGDFRRAQPQHGRFRDYVKTVLFHLVSKHRKRQQALPRPLSSAGGEQALSGQDRSGAGTTDDAERAFTEHWRSELLARTWSALAEVQPTLHAVLRFRAEHPKLPSAQMAERLAAPLGQPCTASSVRQILHRAREKFADLLVDEVAHSLENPTADDVESELAELELLSYCKPALARRDRGDRR